MTTSFPEVDPFDYKVADEEFEGLKLGSYCQSTNKNTKALIFFLPDFGVTAKSFGCFFENFANDSEINMRTYSFDRRGFGRSQGERGNINIDDRMFRDHWDFVDSITFLRGYP